MHSRALSSPDAINQEKRIIPILWRQPGKGKMVAQLADLKWISFEDVEFYGAFSKLIRFLDFYFQWFFFRFVACP